MATYPTPAGKRLAIDEDGTQLFGISDDNVVTQLSAADLLKLNNENEDHITAAFKTIALYFPEVRNLTGLFLATAVSVPITVETSLDTTNFIDGSWSGMTSPGSTSVLVLPYYRTSILGVSVPAKTVRISTSRMDYAACHLYGVRAAGDFLEFSDAFGSSLPDDAFDYKDTSRAESEDRTFYLTNRSIIKSANNVLVTSEAVTDTAPSVPAQYLLSVDKLIWTATIDAGSVAPGATVGPFYARRVTPTNATLGLWAARFQAQAESWS